MPGEPERSKAPTPRRKFSEADKRRYVAEYDALPHGEKRAYLIQTDLQQQHISLWRKGFGIPGPDRTRDPRQGTVEDGRRKERKQRTRIKRQVGREQAKEAVEADPFEADFAALAGTYRRDKPAESLAQKRMDRLHRLRELSEVKFDREAEALRQRDVFAELGYTPTEKQKLFHEATEYSILFGGALGGGKTVAVLAEAIRACVRYPGIRIGAFRRTYGELKESLLAELARFGYAEVLGAKWHGADYELRFPNRSVIMFRYAETMQDATRRQGGQYQMLMFDELTLTPPEVVSFLESRLRSGNAKIPVLGIRASANPGGPGHGEVRKRFIDATNYGQNVAYDERGRSVRFIPSKMEDNPHLNVEYERDLLALPETMRRALRDGDWSMFSGIMFPEFSRERHIVPPVALPATWRRYVGIDWGFAAPWAVLWAAVDEDGRVWIYRELYEKRVGEMGQAKRILNAELTGEHIEARFADDAMWAVRGDAKPIAEVYADNGVFLTKAGKGSGSRVIGWQRVRSYLDEATACPHHRAKGWDTCPRLHIMDGCAENLCREFRDLPHATKGDPEDADTHASEHACDALRYLLINVGGGPEFVLFDDDLGVDERAVVPTPGGIFAMRRPSDPLFSDGPDAMGSNPFEDVGWRIT